MTFSRVIWRHSAKHPSSLARYGGDVAVGAMTVITSASQLCTLPIQGICQGGQPVMSFNFGAGKKARVKEAFRFQLTLCGAYTCLFWLLMMLFPGAVAGIFTSDTALIQYTTWAMRIYMAGIFAMGFQIACQQSFMALGQAKVSLLLACLRKIILLILSSSFCRTFCRMPCSACFWPSRSATFWPPPSPPSPSLPGSIRSSTAVRLTYDPHAKTPAGPLSLTGVLFTHLP